MRVLDRYKIEIDLYFSYFTSFNPFFVKTWPGTWPRFIPPLIGLNCNLVYFFKIIVTSIFEIPVPDVLYNVALLEVNVVMEYSSPSMVTFEPFIE